MNESGTYMESYELESNAAMSSDSPEDDLIDQAAVFEAEYMHVRLSLLLADYMGMVDAICEVALAWSCWLVGGPKAQAVVELQDCSNLGHEGAIAVATIAAPVFQTL